MGGNVTEDAGQGQEQGQRGPARAGLSRDPVAVARLADQLGECPAWSDFDDALYWVDARRPAVHRYSPGSGSVDSWVMPEIVPGLAVAGPQSLVVALRATFALLDTSTGELKELGHSPASQPPMRFNEMKCDRQGRVWIGEMNDERREPVGCLYRADPGGLVRVLSEVVVPNSLCWSPDGRTMYFSDAREPMIWQFDYDPESGIPSGRRRFATLRPDQGFPDGCTVDADGYLWSTNYGGWSVARYSPDGSEVSELRLPTAQITSCAFGDPGLRTLYITTAAQRLAPDDLREQPDAGSLFAARVQVQGLAETPARLPA